MPPTIPLWMPVLGGVFAIIVVKQLYGGLGQNWMNPALAARCFLLISFAGSMTKFTDPVTDAIAGATPLATIKAGGTYDVASMFIGKIPGTIGEVSVIALLIGAAYLLYKKDPDPGNVYSYLCGFCVPFRPAQCKLCSGGGLRRRPDLRRILHGDRLCDQPHYPQRTDCFRRMSRYPYRTVPSLRWQRRGSILCDYLL